MQIDPSEAKKKRIEDHKIPASASLLEALQRMDLNDSKLLMVFEEDRYSTLLSVGDVQRAIINGTPFETPVREVVRADVRVAREGESFEEIRATMLEYLMVFTPVVAESGELLDVVFWEELFEERQARFRDPIDVPVVIMAGGRGQRLRPITNIIPKPLIPVGEKPIMEIIVDRFREVGVRRFYASVNYKAEMIKQHFDSLGSDDYSIEYVYEDRPLGTAGSLALLRGKIDSTFFVSNCDILIDQDLAEVYRYHRDSGHDLTAVAALKHFSIPYGTIEMEKGGQITRLVEKPDLTYIVNAGMYVIEPHVLDAIPDDVALPITELISSLMERGRPVGAFPVSERSWLDIGEWNEYARSLGILGEQNGTTNE